MKEAYFDCFSGISGDMIIGALIDLGLDVKFLDSELKKMKLKGYKIESRKVVKNGISATKFDVIEKHKKNYHGEERNLKEINEIIDNSKLNKNIKKDIKKIFYKIAAAEAKVHKPQRTGQWPLARKHRQGQRFAAQGIYGAQPHGAEAQVQGLVLGNRGCDAV